MNIPLRLLAAASVSILMGIVAAPAAGPVDQTQRDRGWAFKGGYDATRFHDSHH
jgi:hypothetical protein